MKDYTIRQRTLTVSGGSTQSFSLVDSAILNLQVIRQGVGDKRSPVAHAFQKYFKQAVTGSWYLIDNVGKPVYKYGDSGVWNGSLSWTFNNPSSNLGVAAYNNAVSSLYDQIRGNLDLSVDAAEAKQTSSMIRGAWANASSGCIEYAKRAVADAKRQGGHLYLKHLGKAWLNYKYGWMPLLQTAHDLTEKAFLDPQESFRVLIKARGSASDSGSYPFDIGTCPLRRVYKHSFRVELGVALSPRTSRTASLAKYTSLNPVSIAWELLPYSFVVDWFLDVGGYLRAAESALAYRDNFLWGYRTDTSNVEYVHSMRAAVYRLNAYERLVFSGMNAGGGYLRKKDRSILTGMPFPARPVLQTDLGASRLASAASLLAQFLGKR